MDNINKPTWEEFNLYFKHHQDNPCDNSRKVWEEFGDAIADRLKKKAPPVSREELEIVVHTVVEEMIERYETYTWRLARYAHMMDETTPAT